MGEEAPKGKPTRNRIEEAFARYEAKEMAPPTLRITPEPAPTLVRPAPTPAVTVEAQPSRLVGTGVPGLDMVLEGGIPDRSLILVTGETGSHHTTFAEQLLYNHVSDGGKVAYYTAESPSFDIRVDMERFGWSLEEYASSGSWVFVSVRSPDLQRLAELTPQLYRDGLKVNLAQSLNPLKTDLLEKIKESRWTALHLSHILHYFEARDAMDLMLYWRTAARVYGGAHFAILTEGVHPEPTVNALKNLADGVLEFTLLEAARGYQLMMAVRKMRGMIGAGRIASIAVLENGLMIETAERIA